jgi:DNA-binding transcriptional LysR family regulator
MELRHLRYFLAVAEELSFRRAAARLHIAQPPLSVQIRQLEMEVGAELFSRAGHKIKLTDAGRAFFEHARQTLAQVNRSVTAAQQAAKGELGHLSIGCGTAAEFRVFPTIVPAFKRKWPNVHLSFHQLGTMPQIDAVRREELDLGFVWLPISTDEFDVEELSQEPFAALLFANHPLAAAPAVSIKDLSKEPLVLVSRDLDPGLFYELEQLFVRVGAVMDVAYELESIVSLLNFVAMECGCSVVPDYIRSLSRPGIVFKPLRPPNLAKTVAIFKKKGRGGLAESFFRFTVENLPAFDWGEDLQHARD